MQLFDETVGMTGKALLFASKLAQLLKACLTVGLTAICCIQSSQSQSWSL